MAGLIHNNEQVCGNGSPQRLTGDSDAPKKVVGRPPRQRTSDPDHKLPVLEVAMADEANTRIPRERQDDRYARAVPIGQVVHNILTDLAKKVGK